MIAASGQHPLLDPGRLLGELGDPELLGALLVTRTVVLEARGLSTSDIAEALAGMPVFAGPQPDLSELTGFVEHVRRHMEYHGGIGGSVLLLGLGLRGEDPESTHRLLVDFWAHQRARAVTETQVRQELIRYWGMESSEASDCHVTPSIISLEDFKDIWHHLKAEPDGRVANLAAFAMGKGGSTRSERWLSEFTAHKAGHLQELGSEAVGCAGVERYLRTALTHPKADAALRTVSARALQLVGEQRTRLADTIRSLSSAERELVQARSQGEKFRDACILTYLNWAGDIRSGSTYDSEAQAVHGIWAALPWWNIIARNAAEAAAVEGVLDEGVLPLSFEEDPTAQDRLTMIVRKPRTASVGMLARFVFDLANPAHLCELLLIGRRPGVPIDLFVGSQDEWEIEATHVGTSYAAVPQELAGLITQVATQALTRSLPGAWDADHDIYEGIQALTRELKRLRHGRLEHYAAARHITGVPASALDGGITPLVTDPPVSLSAFPQQTTVRKTHHTRQPSAPPGRPSRREIGFVYVQRNPAFPDMLKIGYSERLAEDRAKELSRTSVPFPYEVLFRTASSHAAQVEQAVHRLLAAQRVSGNREFFRVSLDTAVTAIRHCQQTVTGISSWESLPAVHRLRSGDRVVLPLAADEIFALTALPDLFSPAEPLDLWQAHADHDLLEIHVTNDPGHVAGFSDNDPGGDEDPVPFLDRKATAPNGMLLGRERLVAGDRLVWLSDKDGAEHCQAVVFEADSFCQITYRSWALQRDPSGWPLLMNFTTRDISPAMGARVREVLALRPPRTWAPRNPRSEDGWAEPAIRPQPPEFWLRQLGRNGPG
ncbi:GIY-YIG nuclease family protein [Streptomyces sp. AP-93]|uniref:GIY-YIG nuclease family protein n=1 Tax=Streptomyces sp. AP-93 TaxID=2929048 RepID=UPI001FAF4BC2|nr:GIY-YIG nuclease family protein [Streptomyces sp. AP-93]MCJ0871527.1 GIY-YIG nuclease family protein [Streptomyces sp. AP-93]